MPTLMPGLERRLRKEVAGDVWFDRFTLGRYSTDASHYQIEPVGVVAPRTMEDAGRAIGVGKAVAAPRNVVRRSGTRWSSIVPSISTASSTSMWWAGAAGSNRALSSMT